jgi:hypothetical protein
VSGSDGIAEDIGLLSKTVDDMREVAKDNSGGVLKDRYFALLSAGLLAQFYTGLEKCLEKKFKLADIPLPHKSDRYHKDILALAVQAQFIPPQCVEAVDDLLGFRHYARHAYGREYRVDEVREKAAAIERIWPELKKHLPPSADQLKDAVAVKQAQGEFKSKVETEDVPHASQSNLANDPKLQVKPPKDPELP